MKRIRVKRLDYKGRTLSKTIEKSRKSSKSGFGFWTGVGSLVDIAGQGFGSEFTQTSTGSFSDDAKALAADGRRATRREIIVLGNLEEEPA